MTKKEKLNRKINGLIAKEDHARKTGGKTFKIRSKINGLLDIYANWKE